jgi:hypothetical protein
MNYGPILNRRGRIIPPPQWHTFSPPLTRLRLLKRNIPTGLYLYIQTGWYVVKRRREEKFLRMKNQNKSMI